ncbi:MAG TPA: hypothetical protein VN674_08500 [Gemmatimonadales bacterium]|nr:hypothetical protein [Gemmatimonadales bacterium]
MRRVSRVSFAALAAALLAGVTCSFPTDQSDQVFVTVTLSAPLVVQGATITAHGHAFRKTGSGNVPVNDVDFQWSVSDSSVARIVNDGRGTATITGVNAGLVHVVARTAVYSKAADMDSTIRVARALEIDSIKPNTIRYGGRITVYGVGINSIFLAELGPAALVADTFSFVGNPNGLGHMQFWVPFPAHSDQMVAFGNGVFGTAPETTFVNPVDIFEPNDTNPALIDLDAGGPIAQLPTLRFFNPALFFEPFDRNTSLGLDWYRFGQADTTQPVTFVLNAGGAGSDTSHLNIITDSIEYSGGSYFLGPNAWILAPQAGIFGCHGNSFFVPVSTEDSTVLELGSLTSNKFHVFEEYSSPGRYGMRVVRALVRADPSVGPDRFAPNELCDQADANFAAPATTIAVHLGSVPFVDTTLTIDFPHATDWYRFRLDTVNAADVSENVTFATVSRSPGSKDTSDIDVTVLDINGNYMGQVVDSGSTEVMTLSLTTNADYYVVVSDYAGAPVRYGLCIQVATSCPSLPGPAAGVAPGMTSSIPRRALRQRMSPALRAAAQLRALRAAQAARIPFRLP